MTDPGGFQICVIRWSGRFRSATALRLLCVVLLAGFAGCARAPGRMELPGKADLYTLQPGESLFDLAERNYQDRSLGWALATINEIPDPGQTEAGTTVLVPHSPKVLSSMSDWRRPARVPFNRGTYLLEIGRTREAVEQLERALSAAPHAITPRYHLGLAYLRQGHISDAVRELEEVVRRRSLDRDFRYGLGCVYLEQGEVDKARKEFKQALRFDPRFAPAHYGLAVAATRQGKRREASSAWRAYLELEPDGPWTDRASGHLSDLYDE